MMFVVAVTLGLTVGYSRLFLGVHSPDQILYGWLLGVWLAFWIHFCCRGKIMTEAELVSYSEFDYNPRYLKGLAAFVFYNVMW